MPLTDKIALALLGVGATLFFCALFGAMISVGFPEGGNNNREFKIMFFGGPILVLAAGVLKLYTMFF